MSGGNDDDQNGLADLRKRLAEMPAVAGDFDALARLMIDQLVPHKIDRRLWEDVAAGANVALPASDQFGPVADRLKPPLRSGTTKGNDYGRVHAKRTMEPSRFLKRQSDFIAGRAGRIARIDRQIAELERQRADEETRLAEAEHGERLYAVTLLLTAMRRAIAPVFAMGPAWTLLRAIAEEVGDEAKTGDRERDTQSILKVLFKLRDDTAFRRQLKRAVRDVCLAHEAAADRQVADRDWDGPYDIDHILSALVWPAPSEEDAKSPDPDDDNFRPW
ncbi:MAG: hypothetical protein FJ335_06590 [Sphingomonadales bacterium]|nr:hypothetical protein [Sphingomonadales bacterium]